MNNLEHQTSLIAMNIEHIYRDVINPDIDIAEPASEVALRLEIDNNCSITNKELDIICKVLRKERENYLEAK